jgi:hypothetical protein
MAAGSPKTAVFVFVSFFNERAEVLEALQPQLRHLVDVSPQEPNMRRFWQQGEITAAINRMEDQGLELTLQAHQMLAVANATYHVTHNLGRSLRRELLRGNSNLRDGNPRHEDGPVRVGRCGWAGDPAWRPGLRPGQHASPHRPVRPVLHSVAAGRAPEVLDVTPTAARPPSPYPASRSVDTSDLGI